ncbi:relaxase/mobilization nuclease domain-containing protein [Halomonas elongata]|uniref:TraI/MobA(P) family conjugative relaxase n=1 Tax=Halomonas elongata TaxID=2746 RepID=UPI003346DF78
MIAKHVPMRTHQKSSFSRLVRYITDTQDKQKRVQYAKVSNCHSSDPNDAMLEIEAVQASNKRAKSDKTYHLVLSFPAGECPSNDVLDAIESRVCASLGYADHQRVSATHTDTDNLHIHIAINKIHPTKRTLHDPYQSHRTLGDIAAKLEKEYGLQEVNHTSQRTQSEGRAQDMERHAGIESLVSWVRRKCLEDMRKAESWQAMHEKARNNGLRMRLRGNGLIVQADDGTTAKASTIARDLSKPNLEKRLGEFVPEAEQGEGEPREKKHYRPRPLKTRVDTTELYARYKDDQVRGQQVRNEAFKDIRAKKNRRIEAAKRTNKMRRSAIKLMAGSRHTKKLLYVQARKALKSEMDKIHQQYRHERQEGYEKFQRRTWADWLRDQAVSGDKEAIEALRARETAGLKGNTIRGQGEDGRKESKVGLAVDGVTKKGTIIYRAGKSAVRDDGDRLQISKDADGIGLETALRLAKDRYGACLSINGTDEFKERVAQAAVSSELPITFSDPALERRRQVLAKQEEHDERRNRYEREEDGRRADRRGDGRPRQRATAKCGGRSTREDVDQPGQARKRTTSGSSRTQPGAKRAQSGGKRGTNKSNIGRIGQIPPPAARNRLRTLSSLGMVRVTNRSEVLLPGDVRHNLEKQGTTRVDPMRRPIAWAGLNLSAEQKAAAGRYVEERESKRGRGFDIPKHSRYNGAGGDFKFAGVRSIDGQRLVLLQTDDAVMVLPSDEATVRRLKRVKRGEIVSVTPKGGIRRGRGRSR